MRPFFPTYMIGGSAKLVGSAATVLRELSRVQIKRHFNFHWIFSRHQALHTSLLWAALFGYDNITATLMAHGAEVNLADGVRECPKSYYHGRYCDIFRFDPR